LLDVVIYMLSKIAEGWVLYDDEGRTALFAVNLNSALLEAAKAMRDNGDPVQGRSALVESDEVMTLRFTPAAWLLDENNRAACTASWFQLPASMNASIAAMACLMS
jgi:hypothetical protein